MSFVWHKPSNGQSPLFLQLHAATGFSFDIPDELLNKRSELVYVTISIFRYVVIKQYIPTILKGQQLMLLTVLTLKDFSIICLMIVKHGAWSYKLIVVIDPYVWCYIALNIGLFIEHSAWVHSSRLD